MGFCRALSERSSSPAGRWSPPLEAHMAARFKWGVAGGLRSHGILQGSILKGGAPDALSPQFLSSHGLCRISLGGLRSHGVSAGFPGPRTGWPLASASCCRCCLCAAPATPAHSAASHYCIDEGWTGRAPAPEAGPGMCGGAGSSSGALMRRAGCTAQLGHAAPLRPCAG